MKIWFIFFLNAAFIVAAGMLLTKNAEKVSRGFGLSSAWAGALLLPLATSLPELVTTHRAVLIEAPDLAGGNIYGSILFNITLIALIDLAQGRGPLTARRKRSLIVTALLSITIIIISMLGILLALPYRIGWVGIDSLIILLVYLLGSSMIMSLESKKRGRINRDNGRALAVPEGPAKEQRKETLRGLLLFSAAAIVIIFAGTNLTDTADLISEQTGLNRTLVGSLFIAVATSLPELVTTMTAVRLGNVEMAVANVFGANFFNILILFFADSFYTRGLLFMNLSPQNLIAALMGVLLTIVVLFSLIYPLRRDFLRMGLASYIVIFGYLLTFIFLFSHNNL